MTGYINFHFEAEAQVPIEHVWPDGPPGEITLESVLEAMKEGWNGKNDRVIPSALFRDWNFEGDLGLTVHVPGTGSIMLTPSGRGQLFYSDGRVETLDE